MTFDKTLAAIPLSVDDPRVALDDRALVAAGRNAFPLVARRASGRDGLGMALGTLGALALGAMTFWTMNAHREMAALPPPSLPAPAAPPVAPIALQAPPLPIHAPVPAPAASAAPAPDHSRAPVMVFDVSASPASVPAPQPAAPAVTGETAPGKPAAQQQLSENEAFASRVGNGGVETVSATRLTDPSHTITQGTFIAAVLETAIDSDLPGYARAIVSQDVLSFDGSHVLIPRSSRLIGQYKSGLAAGQTRTYVMWTRLIRPDGVSVALGSPATDYAGQSGLSGEVDSHFMQRFGSATLLSVVGGLSALGSGGTTLVMSGGQNAASVAAQRDAQIPPTVHVAQGQPIRVFTARDLDFSPVAEAVGRP